MKVILTISILMFLTFSVIGQDNKLKTKLIDETYSWRTASAEQLDSVYLNLQPIQKTNYKTHIRISLTGQIIDFYSFDNETYQGILTNYIIEYKSVKEKNSNYEQSKEYQYIFEKINLSPILIKQAVQKLFSTGQPEIPTDTLILSWQRFYLDCNSLKFQFNSNGQYHKQTFSCPWGQEDTVQYRDVILENYKSLKSKFQLDSVYKIFEKKLPKGKSYSRDGYIMNYFMTDQQSKNWKKNQPVRDYMKTVKDTIDNYLKAELSKQLIELEDIDCFENYRLIFGKKGKLKKIEVSEYDKPNIKDALSLSDYFKDRREIRKCKKRIKSIFLEIDLSFLNLKYEIHRTFNFRNKKEFQLSDDTVY